MPLGLIDIQGWARDPRAIGKARSRKARGIEDKESLRWLKSLRRTAEVQRLCPATRLVNLAEGEADIDELFQAAAGIANGPDLLIRANRTTQRQAADADERTPLWDDLPAQPLAGTGELAIPGRGGRKARVAQSDIRSAPIQLCPPERLQGEALSPWAIHVVAPAAPPDSGPLAWLLLTTVPTSTLEEACERLSWYAVRWQIEVFHRTRNSGCRIEERRLADAESLRACLALALVVAWRVMHLGLARARDPGRPLHRLVRRG